MLEVSCIVLPTHAESFMSQATGSVNQPPAFVGQCLIYWRNFGMIGCSKCRLLKRAGAVRHSSVYVELPWPKMQRAQAPE